jgi:protein-L-isoaspartate(D-aspartate) O-methyltransferase
MTDFAQARKTMVDNQLRTSGITDRRLLAAMGEVAREAFVPVARRGLAYIDVVQPLGRGRALSAPAPFARLIQLAAIEHTDRVLDLGCATGYSAAVIARLAAEVVAVESDAALAAEARVALSGAAAGVTLLEGPLETAGANHSPFDVIVVEVAMADVPASLFAQLKPDGRLVAVLATGGRPAVAHLFAKSGEAVAARAAFDAHLPVLSAPERDSFVF